MKKKSFCGEIRRIIYNDCENQTSHCKLDCIINLFPDKDDMVPYGLINYLKKKYPCKVKVKGETIRQTGLEHQYADVFNIHIETRATCHSGDTFDAKKGKTIAYSKAQLKLYNLLERVFTDVEKFFEMNKDSATQAKQMFTRYANREASFLKTL